MDALFVDEYIVELIHDCEEHDTCRLTKDGPRYARAGTYLGCIVYFRRGADPDLMLGALAERVRAYMLIMRLNN